MSDRTANEIWSGSSTAFPSVGDFMTRAWETLLEWQQRANDRAALASLDSRMLDDIGVNRADAWRESHKPFWRA